MNNLFQNTKRDNSFGNIYKAKSINSFGINNNDQLVYGLHLVLVSEGNSWDSLEEMIGNVGSDFICHFPDEGLVENSYYECDERCILTDCNDTELYIRKIV